MKLAKLIPKDLGKSFKQTTTSSLSEIKIVPNSRIKVGFKWKFPEEKNSSYYWEIVDTFIDENGKEQYLANTINLDGSISNENIVIPKKGIEQAFREGRVIPFKKLDEIKIVPNFRQPQIGDVYKWVNGKEAELYDEGFWSGDERYLVYIFINHKDNHSFIINAKDFVNYIRNKEVILIKKIDEIKIVPNSPPPKWVDEYLKQFHQYFVTYIQKLLNNVKIYDILDSIFKDAKDDRLRELLKSIIKNDNPELEINVDNIDNRDLIELVDNNEELYKLILKGFSQYYFTTINYQEIYKLYKNYIIEYYKLDIDDDPSYIPRFSRSNADYIIEDSYDKELFSEPFDIAWEQSDKIENILYKYLQKSYDFLNEIKIIPNQKINTNEKLLFFVNRHKEDIITDIVLTGYYDEVAIEVNNEARIEELIATPCKLYGDIIKINPENFYSLHLTLDDIYNDYIIYKDVKIFYA